MRIFRSSLNINADVARISTENYQSGVYFVNVIDNKGVSYTTKMMVHH
jgi:hypothetical protein